MSTPLLEVKDLRTYFHIPTRRFGGGVKILKAVDGVSFTLNRGETLGVVGESGCGKSTLGRTLLQLHRPESGEVHWEGKRIDLLSKKEMRPYRKEMSMIFQDPYASLNPRMPIGEIVAEPLLVHEPHLSKSDRKKRVQEMLDYVGIHHNMASRYPHEFSGGQCQRIGVARAMILKPKLVVCDEAVSALDVSIQAQVIDLLETMQKEFGVSLVFISHDLSVVRHISDRVMVLYLGKPMLISSAQGVYEKQRHPYAKVLISSVPEPDPERERERVPIILGSELPSPINPPSGCVFRTRCPEAFSRCREEIPILRPTPEHDGLTACWKEGYSADSTSLEV